METDPQRLRELAVFGVRMDTGRPILEQVDTNPCTKCNGFGTYGNPLCGAVYTCQQCKGTGYQPEKPKKISRWQRFVKWIRNET